MGFMGSGEIIYTQYNLGLDISAPGCQSPRTTEAMTPQKTLDVEYYVKTASYHCVRCLTDWEERASCKVSCHVCDSPYIIWTNHPLYCKIFWRSSPELNYT